MNNKFKIFSIFLILLGLTSFVSAASSDYLIEKDFPGLNFTLSRVLLDNCELMELEGKIDSRICDSYSATYGIGMKGIDRVEVVVEVRPEKITNGREIVENIARNFVKNEGMTSFLDQNSKPYVELLKEYDGYLKDIVVIWVSENKVIATSVSKLNYTIVDDDIFKFNIVNNYLKKYPVNAELENENLCKDSDGGKNYFTKGTATGYEGDQLVTSTDGCRYDDKTLAEVYCDGKNLLVAQYVCEGKCVDGACIEESIPEGVYKIEIRGNLVDQITGKPVRGAKLISAYDFSPSEVITDENGKFNFFVRSDFLLKEGPEAGNSSRAVSFSFYMNCYTYSSSIVLQKDYEEWESGSIHNEYDMGLVIVPFDGREVSRDVSGKKEIDVKNLEIYPHADISINSDIAARFSVMYEYKNLDGYNGPGNSNFKNEHYLTGSLPLDYNVFIEFTDESGETYKSSTYEVPSNAMCGIISLDYSNGESEWSVLSSVEPTEESGPIEINLPEEAENNPEVVSGLCSGCFRDKNCYPLGYRKSGKYCSEDKNFITQLGSDSTCDNNFECESNVCVNGQCISSGLIQRIINWLSNLFG